MNLTSGCRPRIRRSPRSWRRRGGFVFPLDFVSCGERGLRHLPAAKAVARRGRRGRGRTRRRVVVPWSGGGLLKGQQEQRRQLRPHSQFTGMEKSRQQVRSPCNCGHLHAGTYPYVTKVKSYIYEGHSRDRKTYRWLS